MDERTDPRIMRRAPTHASGDAFDDVARIIDLRTLEGGRTLVATPTAKASRGAAGGGYRGDDVETDRSRTTPFVRRPREAGAKPEATAAAGAAAGAAAATASATAAATPSPTIRRTRQPATERLVLPAVRRRFDEIEPTLFIPRARPLAWPTPAAWALMGMAILTLLSMGACAALVLMMR